MKPSKSILWYLYGLFIYSGLNKFCFARRFTISGSKAVLHARVPSFEVAFEPL